MSEDRKEVIRGLAKEAKEAIRYLAKLTGTQLGSEIEPMKARCNSCEKTVDHGELLEGKCEKCVAKANGENLSQATLRRQAFERDRGRCFACGVDTEKERVELEQMREWLSSPTTPEHAHFAKNRLAFYKDQRGYLESEIQGMKALWEAHHERERARGGPDTLGNIKTACAPCHAKLSGDFSRIRKVTKKPQRRFGR